MMCVCVCVGGGGGGGSKSMHEVVRTFSVFTRIVISIVLLGSKKIDLA